MAKVFYTLTKPQCVLVVLGLIRTVLAEAILLQERFLC